MLVAINRVVTVLREDAPRSDGGRETTLGLLAWAVPLSIAAYALGCAFLALEPLR